MVLHADPDLLLVHWSPTSSLTFIFWVGHAPHKGHTEDVKAAWWSKCRDLLSCSAGNAYIVGMLDANAAIGSHTSDSVQDFAAEDEDFNGGLFHELLADLDLFLPSIFSGLHQGPSVTWFSSAAKQAKGIRNDFVVIPRNWIAHRIHSYVLPDLEVAQKNMDHLAVVLHVVGNPPKTMRQSPSRSQIPIDWAAVRACRDPRIWNDIFAPLTQPPWEVDVHNHWHHCHSQLTAQLRKRFPKKRSFPRKPYITEEVWAWRNKRKSLRRQALLRAHLCPQLDFLVPFQVWARRIPFRKAFFNGVLWLLRCHAAHLRDKQTYKDTQAQLKAALQVQRRQYLDKVAEEADHAPPQEIYKKLRAAGFSSSRKSKFRPLPYVLQSNGQPAQDIETLRQVWRAHFAAIECGHEIPAQELLQLCIYSDMAMQYKPPQDLLACMPTLQDFERMLLKCQPNKAAGPDGLVPEICKYAARHMSHFLAPLFLKQACYAAEPIHHKGGILFELYKGRGSMQDASSYRGILVSSHVAKAFHNVYRQEALPFHLATADPLQFGGTPGMGVDFASHTLRLFLRNHQLAGVSCPVFYLDIKSAYYRLLRCLAIGPTCSYNEFIRLMRTMDIPPDAAECLIRATHDPNALTAAGAPEWLRQMGAAFHKHTWYHVRGDNAVTATLRGTRPGDGWADLLFNMVLSKVTQDIEKELCDLGLEIVLTWNGQRSFEAQAPGPVETKAMQVAWADDLAILVKHGSASQLMEALPVVISTYIDRLASRGLLLNFGSGKSEVLLLLRGAGSQQLRRDIFSQPEPSIDIHTDLCGSFSVRLVYRYKHLGVTVHANGHLMSELRLRVGQSNAAFNKFRAAIFQNTKLALCKRVNIFNACVFSIFFWGSGTWPVLRACEFRYCHGAFLRLLRRLIAKDVPQELSVQWSETQLCAFVRILPFTAQLRAQRIAYYGRLVAKAPDPLWALLAQERQWLDNVKLDLEWFWTQIQSKVFRPRLVDPDGLQYWRDIILHHPGTWKGLLKKMRAHVLLQQDIAVARSQFHKDFLARLGDLDLLPHDANPPQRPQVEDCFFCLPCGKAFATRTAWATHSFRKHHRRARERFVVDQTVCGHCFHAFHSPHRLYLHLRTSPTCFQALRLQGISVDPLPGKGSKSWCPEAEFTLCPFQQAAGPAGPVPADEDAIPTISDHECALLLDLMNLEVQWQELVPLPDNPVDLWPAVCEAIRTHPVSMQEVYQVCEVWFAFVRREHPRGRRLVSTFYHVVEQTIRLAMARCSYEWICPDLLDAQPTFWNHQTAEAQLAEIPLEHWQRCPSPTTGPCFYQPVFLHLFSGRRRSGDFQDKLEQMDFSSVGWHPVVISMDVVLDAKWGNALDKTTQQFWLDLAKRGAIAGLLAGPPCETWSVSRERFWKELVGPRPLRRQSCLWGLPSLSLGEARQLLVSNGLLMFALQLFLELWIRGQWAALEHPAHPDSERFRDAPSIWDLAILKLLCGLPHVQLATILQGYLGALSPKPTSILLSHSVHFEDFAKKFYVRSTLPPAVTMGRSNGGLYNTAPLKEYPAALNDCLAAAWHEWLLRNQVASVTSSFTDYELGIFQKLCSSIGDGELGPDFACGI